jgi:DNA-binding CsgD family transcriptional regulator
MKDLVTKINNVKAPNGPQETCGNFKTRGELEREILRLGKSNKLTNNDIGILVGVSGPTVILIKKGLRKGGNKTDEEVQLTARLNSLWK